MAPPQIWCGKALFHPRTAAEVEMYNRQQCHIAVVDAETRIRSNEQARKHDKNKARQRKKNAERAHEAPQAAQATEEGFCGPKRVDSGIDVDIPASRETVSVEIGYTLRGVHGTVTFEIDAQPRTPYRRASSMVSDDEAEKSMEVDSARFLAVDEEMGKTHRRHSA